MNKITNVVYSGWMVKSPPENRFRLTGPWKIFRAKWKRRFFVLFKPASSLPHQYLLNYYPDENCKKPKGCIDLEHCEQVIESLDLDLYPYLLALKTFHKGRERTYFLATDTEEEMTTWVRNLCSVCGLKPEDTPDLPPDRDTESQKSYSVSTTQPRARNPAQRSSSISTLPRELPKRPTINHARSGSGSHYIPISECSTKADRRFSEDSIPDELAPPPPPKPPKPLPAEPDDHNDVFLQQTYDTPKQRMEDSLYKVPPPRNHNNANLDVYDVPPRQSPSTPRSSSSENADSAYSSQAGLTYDYPPSHPAERGGGDNKTSDDVYDVPPSHNQGTSEINTDAAPPRPPKTQQSHTQEPYQNLPPNSKVFKDFTDLNLNKVVPPAMTEGLVMSYDVPRPQSRQMYDHPKRQSPPTGEGANKDSNLLVIPPPPKSCSGPTSHSYMNANKGSNRERAEDVYLPMERAFPDTTTGYTDMTGVPEYDSPPKRPLVPPRSASRSNVTQKQESENDTYTIFSTSRTRSFKRNGSSGSESKDHGRVEAPITLRVELPSRSENRHPDFSTSSEDEEDSVLGDVSQVMVPYHVLTSQNSQLWGRAVPAPKQQDMELKYVDLALDSSSEPVRSPHSYTTGSSTPIEYREIDFVKTQALSDVKKSVDMNRKLED